MILKTATRRDFMEKKKFKNYYLDGIKNSYKSLYKRKTNIFKYYICIFIYILSIPLFILKPVVNMGIFRFGEQINDDNDIDLTTITKSCDNPKNYFTALFACLIKIFIITGIILVLLAIAGVLALIGYIFMIFTKSEEYLFIVLYILRRKVSSKTEEKAKVLDLMPSSG